MEEEVLKKYIEAGRIARIVLEEAAKRIDVGVKLVDICEYAEKRIVELGGQPAFPCNISVNEVAAHYTPRVGDESTVPEGAVVKLDIGVHVDGYIADTATTVVLDPAYEKLAEAVREALEKALEKVRKGVAFYTISKTIESVIRSYGYKPIVNLGGHSLDRYVVHAGESIPNAADPLLKGSFKAGKVYAIEPFATTGVGYVEEGDIVTIYALHQTKLRRRLTPFEKKMLAYIASKFRTLPFTERWLVKDLGDVDKIRVALARLAKMGFLIQYPILVEKSRGIVAQFEHTIVVLEDNVIVTTAKE